MPRSVVLKVGSSGGTLSASPALIYLGASSLTVSSAKRDYPAGSVGSDCGAVTKEAPFRATGL